MTSPPPRGRLVLAAADRAVLDRLRAIALLLRAGSGAKPALAEIDVALWTSTSGDILPFAYLTAAALPLLACAAGRPDFLEGGHVPVARIQSLLELLLLAERTEEYPPGLRHLLHRIHHDCYVSAAVRATLAQAQWKISNQNDGFLRPILPIDPSAHEVLELLLAVESSGGLGSGPLATLAHTVAATLAGGSR